MKTPDWILEILARVAFEVENLDDDPDPGSVADWDSYEYTDRRPYQDMAWHVAVGDFTLEEFLDKFARSCLKDYPDPIDAEGLIAEETERFQAMKDVLVHLRKVMTRVAKESTARRKRETAAKEHRRGRRHRKQG